MESQRLPSAAPHAAASRPMIVLGQRVGGFVRTTRRALAKSRAAYRRLPRWGRVVVILVGIAPVATWEFRTSALEARILAGIAKTLTYPVQPGPSRRIIFPRGGPFDQERGYSRIADFSRRVEGKGYRLVSQSRFSPALAVAAVGGVTPPYAEPNNAGLLIVGAGG